MGILSGIKNFVIGDTSQQRDKVNAENWGNVSDAINNRSKALAYQSAMKDYFDKNPDQDSSAYKDVLSDDFLDDYSSAVNEANNYYTDQYTKNRWNELGKDGILSDTLRAVGQTASIGANALSSLRGGERDNWTDSGSYRNRRDVLSDIGAVAQTALELATAGAGIGAKTLGKTLAKGALTGAGYGVTNELMQNGKDTNMEQLATAAGVGGLMSAGLGAAGYGLGKLWNKYSSYVPSKSTVLTESNASAGAGNTMGAGSSDMAAYQEALNTLKNAGIDTSSDEAMKSSYRKAALKLHPDKIGGTGEEMSNLNSAMDTFKSLRDVVANAQSGTSSGATTVANTGPVVANTFLGKLKNFGLNVPNMGKDLANSKAGTTVSNLLKSKVGKAGVGLGGGLLLAKLLNNGGSSDGGLTDEELQELYNNYYGGY